MSSYNERLNGLHPLAYLGVNPQTPVPLFTSREAPTTQDSQNVSIGTIWVQQDTPNIWMLTSLSQGEATWTQFAAGTTGVFTLTGNSGGAINPDSLGNVNITGDGTFVTVSGSESLHTLGITLSSTVPVTFLGDTGSAVASAGQILITGGTTGLTTAASASTLGLVGDLNVSHGGTGRTTLVPYAPLIGGTSTTAAIQFADTGQATAGFVLTSNGTSAPPSFKTLSPYITLNDPNLEISIGDRGVVANTISIGFGNSTAIGTSSIAIGNDVSGSTANQSVVIGTTISGNVGGGSVAIGAQITGDVGNLSIVIYPGFNINAADNTTYIANIDGVTITGSAVYVTSDGQLGVLASSKRFKNSVEDMGVTPVTDLRPVTFEYNKEPGVTQYGLIAEEVAEIFPSLVHYGKDGKPFSVKYDMLPVLLLNEIKSLKKEIAELKSR